MSLLTATVASGVGSNVVCIRCQECVFSMGHMMGCVGLRGFPVSVIDDKGFEVVTHGWATHPYVDKDSGLLYGVEVHDNDRGDVSVWPLPWVKMI